MTTENRYIEEIEDEPLQPQQQGFYPAYESGTGRNRTTKVYQDSQARETTWWCSEKVQDEITSQIQNNLVQGLPYTVVTSATEYVAAMEDSTVLNVYCDDGSGKGILVTSGNAANFDISPINSKNVFGAGGYCLYYEDGNTMVTDITLPSSDNGNDIKINFFHKLSFNGSSFSVGGVLVEGGYSGNDYEVNFSNLEITSDSINLAASDTATDMHGKVKYEVIESELTSPLTSFLVDSPVNVLWSGIHTMLKQTSLVSSNPAEVHTICEGNPFPVPTFKTMLSGAIGNSSPDTARAQIEASITDTVNAFTDLVYARILFARRQVSNGSYMSVVLGDVLGTMLEAMRVYADGNVQIEKDIFLPNITTGLAGNALYITGGGQVYENTSSRRFKENERSFEIPSEKVLEIINKTYERKESGTTEHGPISEEVSKIHASFATYDKDEVTPRGINQDNIVWCLLEEVKKLRKEVNELRGADA